MSRPKWQEAVDGEPQEKMAVALKTGPDGRTRVVAAGTGAEAEKIIASARAAGVEVRQDADEVQELIASEGDESSVPPQIYELMATVVNFAQELNEQWLSERSREPMED